MGLVEVSFDGRVLDGSVHAFDLPVGPGMLGHGQAMIDIVVGAGVFEGVRPDGLSGVEGSLNVGGCRARVAWRGEVGSVVGEDRVDFIGDGGDQATQEISCGPPRDFLMQFDEGELRRPVDGDDEMELALSGSDLGEVDMEIADRIGLELTLGRSLAFDLRQPGDPMALKAAMQRRARQVRNCRLKRVEAVVERQQRMPPEGDHDRLLFNGQDG